ncbi:hypothetical protein MY9_0223 [Bacillus sp. JS]|nr:hypothetical protein MY9_0223 [Bacillus sp. JS]
MLLFKKLIFIGLLSFRNQIIIFSILIKIYFSNISVIMVWNR